MAQARALKSTATAFATEKGNAYICLKDGGPLVRANRRTARTVSWTLLTGPAAGMRVEGATVTKMLNALPHGTLEVRS